MAKRTTLQEFEAVFPTLEKVLVDDIAKYGLPEAYVEWFRRVRTEDTWVSPAPRIPWPFC